MSRDKTPDWLAACLESTDFLLGNLYAEEPDDTFGWGAMLQQMWQQARHPSGLLLLGPDGCGKHTAAWHMLRLLNENGYEGGILVLGEPDLDDARADELIAWSEESLAAKQKLCLVLDQLRNGRVWTKLASYLSSRLTQNRCNTEDPYPLFLIVIPGQALSIPARLRAHLLRCRMCLPSREYREAFFSSYLETHFAEDLSQYAPERLLELTEGFTYAQLKDLAYHIGLMLQLYSPEELGEELGAYIDQLALEQTPEPVPEPADPLTEKLAELVELFPQLISGLAALLRDEVLPAPQPVPVPEPEPVKPSDGGWEAKEKERIRNLSGAELYQELFGALEERRAQRARLELPETAHELQTV